ncbi:MAG: tRNA pseudouridine(55) synthase TruB [Calditrichaceae bacterium]
MIQILKKNNVLTKDGLEKGFLVLINKEENWTSFDAVKKIRNYLKIRKVGHAGTLDPFATGLLILGVGQGTKMMAELSGLSKTYRALVRFGIETDTYDRTGKTVRETAADHLELNDIEKAVEKMTGNLEQVPPMYSAKKINGQPLYKLARKGIEIERKPVNITIHDARVLNWKSPLLSLDLNVSKGTYIRSYAHELGKLLEVGACLDELERTSIGQYKLEDSFTINEFIGYWKDLAA